MKLYKQAALAAVAVMFACSLQAAPHPLIISCVATNGQTAASTATSGALGYLDSITLWSVAGSSETGTVTVIEYSGSTALHTLATVTLISGVPQTIRLRNPITSNTGAALVDSNTNNYALVKSIISGSVVLTYTPATATATNVTCNALVTYDNGSVLN